MATTWSVLHRHHVERLCGCHVLRLCGGHVARPRGRRCVTTTLLTTWSPRSLIVGWRCGYHVVSAASPPHGKAMWLPRVMAMWWQRGTTTWKAMCHDHPSHHVAYSWDGDVATTWSALHRHHMERLWLPLWSWYDHLESDVSRGVLTHRDAATPRGVHGMEKWQRLW